jgi:hypothetical protein
MSCSCIRGRPRGRIAPGESTRPQSIAQLNARATFVSRILAGRIDWYVGRVYPGQQHVGDSVLVYQVRIGHAPCTVPPSGGPRVPQPTLSAYTGGIPLPTQNTLHCRR